MTAKEFIKFEQHLINANIIILGDNGYKCKLLNNKEYKNIEWKINNNAKVSSSKELSVIVNDDIYTSSLLIYSNAVSKVSNLVFLRTTV
jgi:predicted polyphosphate/ATP-dependent NAD kinase